MRTAKYGASIRKLFEKSINSKNASYECPKCRKLKLKRKSNSVWTCKSCKSTFAGGAYVFRTEAGEISSRLMREYSKSAS